MNDPLINVCSESGFTPWRLPDEIEEACGADLTIRASSLATLTGLVDVRSGGIFNNTTMAAQVGVNKYYLVNSVFSKPEFAFVFKEGKFCATYPNSLQSAWDLYKDEQLLRTRERQPEATRASFKKLLEDI